MHEKFIKIYKQLLATMKSLPAKIKPILANLKTIITNTASLLFDKMLLLSSYKRFVNAGATLIFLLCLCLSVFLTPNTSIIASVDQNESGNISDTQFSPSIDKNPLHQTTLPSDTSTEESAGDSTNENDTLPEVSLGTRYVSGTCVNFRSEPSLDSVVIEKLYRNTQLELLATSDGDFYRVRYNGVAGYMHKDYLSETEITVVVPSYSDFSYITNLRERVATIATNNQSTQPCTHGYCAKWVSGVYQAAGLGYPGGHAIDYWNNWSYSGSTSMDNIPVGAVVVGSGSGSELANQYGHVGVYLGNGMVADNVGYHRIISLEDWAATNVGICQGHQGFIGWVWPYGQEL